MAAPGGDNQFVEVGFRLIASEPLRAFSIVFESGGLLRHHQFYGEPDRPAHWGAFRWNSGQVFGYNGFEAWSNGVILASGPATYLITGGRWVVQYGVGGGRPEPAFLEAGEYSFSLPARLPLGLPAGTYPVSVHPASEVYLLSGKVFSPQPLNEASLVVEREINTGWDERLPPLQLDPLGKKVLGKLEFRFTDPAGNPAAPGSPVAEALPGGEVTLRLQMRTGTPLNHFQFKINWYDTDLGCADQDVTNLFRNPEDGELYKGGSINSWAYGKCIVFTRGEIAVGYHLAGAGFHSSTKFARPNGLIEDNSYPFRPFEYFQPLDEWTDLIEFTLKVDPAAVAPKEIPLEFKFDPQRFDPYSVSMDPGCDRPYVPVWSYEPAIVESATVLVLGDQRPPEVPDFGIRMRVGEVAAAGSPGEIIEVPVFAGTLKPPVSALRWVLEMGPGPVLATALDLNVLTLPKGWNAHAEIRRGEAFVIVPDRVCAGVPDCHAVAPRVASFFDGAEHLLRVEVQTGEFQAYFNREAEVGKLLLRVEEAAPGAEMVIGPGRLETGEESGGIGLLEPNLGKFGPASEFVAGKVRFTGFLRGDANADGAADVSDAVTLLGVLFLGAGALACDDGADADDSGLLDVTDAVVLLGALFLGEGPLPAPAAACGPDLTGDPLGCRTTGCGK